MAPDHGGVTGRTRGRHAAAVAVIAAIATWLGELLPAPWSTLDRRLLHAIAWPAVCLMLLLSVAWLAIMAVLSRGRAPVSDVVLAEEPLLDPPHVVPCRSSVPVVAAAGLEPGAGVTTLTFNLAVSLAVLGMCSNEQEPRRARPACLLTEGPLTEGLRLSPMPLDDYMDRHRFAITPEVVNLAVRHPSGAELFCLKSGDGAVERLRPLVLELRRHYDAVLVDGRQGHRELMDVAVDHGDALLLVALPAARSIEATGPWMERVWGFGIEGKTALLLNRVRAWPTPHPVLEQSFLYHAQLPDDRGIESYDLRGLPWSLDERLPVARHAAGLARQLFPTLIAGARRDAT